MPYKNNKDLLDSNPSLEEKYNQHGLNAFRKAFNSCEEDLNKGEDESKCYAIAHHAAKQAEASEQIHRLKNKFLIH